MATEVDDLDIANLTNLMSRLSLRDQPTSFLDLPSELRQQILIKTFEGFGRPFLKSLAWRYHWHIRNARMKTWIGRLKSVHLTWLMISTTWQENRQHLTRRRARRDWRWRMKMEQKSAGAVARRIISLHRIIQSKCFVVHIRVTFKTRYLAIKAISVPETWAMLKNRSLKVRG
jgi:hypothetical protein